MLKAIVLGSPVLKLSPQPEVSLICELVNTNLPDHLFSSESHIVHLFSSDC